MRRFPTAVFSILGLFSLMLLSTYLISDASQNSARFGRLYIGLLAVNALILLVLFLIINVNLYKLIRQVIKRHPGSRLTLRLAVMFVVLALIPAVTVYVFSVQLLGRGIDSWFDVSVERALEDSLELSRSSLDLHMRQLRHLTEPMVRSLEDTPNSLAALTLSDMLRTSGAAEMTLFGDDNRVIASSGGFTASLIPRMTGERVLRLISDRAFYIGLDPIKEIGLHIHLVLPVSATRQNPEYRVFQVLYPFNVRINDLANSVQGAFGKYNELVYLRTPLKQSFILTLSLVLLSGVLFAVWAALYSSRKLMMPISELAEGTKSVAAGEYHKRLPVGKRDDLGLLVMSFNQMTERLAAAHDAAQVSQRIVESQRTHLQTVLEHLSSGVMSFNLNMVMDTVNAAATHIMGVDLGKYQGDNLMELAKVNSMLGRFCGSIEPHLQGKAQEWQEQVVLFSGAGRKILMCRGAKLPTGGNLPGGHVVVFDDVTALIKAQRDAAWSEVARRLAHEIKNPLTPIQLSAERLRHKLLPRLDSNEATVLDRSTRTIVQQVESMKTMVNAFGDYARPVSMETEPLDLNELITNVIELYRANPIQARIAVKLASGNPRIEADSVRIRQVLHNLIKNSLEALEGVDQPVLSIETQCGEESTGTRYVDIQVTDNGPGFPPQLMERLFEPYVTGKPKGNGLGLAIVKKIVEEHGGMVQAENKTDGGACVRIRLLLVERGSVHNLEFFWGDVP
ncbi:MAG: HAMP domain-containing protein [Gammaproteobacteria bacterium]|nr:HAMP domain-containing protein [Gammaproteobacteria bacterium]